MVSSRSAAVWLAGSRIGQVSSSSRTDVRFKYDEQVLDAYPLNTPVLSCSLPTTSKGSNARAFFAGLLPEGDHRRALAARVGVLDTDVFRLLERYGQDVAGAVVVGEGVAQRPDASALPYTAESLDDEVAALAAHVRPLAVHDDSQLSIAGLQDKMLLVELPGGGWARPVHGYPSTHILKIDDRVHSGLVVAEHTCLLLAAAAGLPAAESRLERFGDAQALVLRRFDRTPQVAGMPQRIHQEDACQALGIDLEFSQGAAKYEAQGGPTLRRIAYLLNDWGGSDEQLCLLDQAVFTVLIGNADAHGKNVSLLHQRPGEISLAPFYDTVPTALWPNLRTRAAMSIGGALDVDQIGFADLVREARSWGIAETAAGARVRDAVLRVRDACTLIERPDHEMAAQAVSNTRANCDRLLVDE